MSTTVAFTNLTTYTVIDCPRCNMLFAITQEFESRRREDHRTFYCPSGHEMSYGGRNEAEKLRAQLDQAMADRNRQAQRADRNYREAEHARRVAAARKGVLTKMRRKIAAGSCPVPGCKRTFTNIMLHMSTEHPEFHDHELPEEKD